MGSRKFGWLFRASLLAMVGCSYSPDASVSAPESGSAAPSARVSRPRVSGAALAANGLEEVWYNPPGDVDQGVHSADLLGDSLFICSMPNGGSKGNLKKLLRSNLNTKWYFEINEPIKQTPTVYQYPQGTGAAANEVFFSQLDTIYCVDLRYGDLLWRQKLDFPISTRILADDLSIFVGSDNGRAYGVRKNSKVEDWTYLTGSSMRASPAVNAPNVYFASTDGYVYKLAGRTGWVHGSSWKFKTGARVVADPAVFSRWVFVGSTDYKLYALESADGTVAWTFQAEAPIEDSPVVYSHKNNQDYVYCVATERVGGAEKKTLFSTRVSNGEQAWRAAGIRKVVAMGKNSLYVINDSKNASDRSIVALDIQTGQERFRFSIAGFDFVPTNNADGNHKERGRIYLVAVDGTIQVLSERL